MTNAPACIFCERHGRWAAAFRRETAASRLALIETRSFADAWHELARRPGSFLVLELTPGSADRLFRRLIRLEREHPTARAALVAARSMVDFGDWARELGAVWFTTSPREMAPLVAIARRRLAEAPAPALSFAEQIWASLPWPRAAGGSLRRARARPRNEPPQDPKEHA